MKWLLIAISILISQVYAQSVDIELDRYPVLLSKTRTNEKVQNDLDTIRYTKVFRFAPKSEKDFSSAKKTYKRNDLNNNSIIGIPNDYPSWLINDIQSYNNDQDSEDLIRVFGKAYSFSPVLFTRHYYKGKWYQHYRKAKNSKNKTVSITEKKSLEGSKHILTSKPYPNRPVFAFNPRDFDSDQDHILKINPESKLYVMESNPNAHGPKSVPIPLAGKEIEFIQTRTNRYKYKLTCKPDFPESLNQCERALTDHYNRNPGKSPRDVIDQYLAEEKFDFIRKACFHCDYEPYFRLSIPKTDDPQDRDKFVPTLTKKIFIPSSVYKIMKGQNKSSDYNLYQGTAEVVNEIFAIDKEFSFMKDLLKSGDQFQTMISKVGGRDIKSITYPRNAYASYHYSNDNKGAVAESKTLLNPYSACMFQKVQREHVRKIIESDYFSVNSNFSSKLHSCLKKNHPNVPEEKLKRTRTILDLLKSSSHPCSDLILNTGSALQYGDMGIAYSFRTFYPHDSHKEGSCIDTRPMRQTHIDRANFLEKINHEINIIKNKRVINDINNFMKKIATGSIDLEGLRSSQSYLDKRIPDLFKKEKDEDGNIRVTAKQLRFSELPGETKKFVMGEYINHAIALHDQGEVNPAVSAYFLYSMRAMDSDYDSIKDENTTNDFIRLLKDQGADHDTLAYSEGNVTHARSTHNNKYYKLGLEITRNWRKHNDHVHFCFDYKKAEKTLDQVIEIYKQLANDEQYVLPETINEVMNKGVPDSLAVDYFQGLGNKIDCLKHIPSKFNQERKNEIDLLRKNLGSFY